jgi:hypothetical protein
MEFRKNTLFAAALCGLLSGCSSVPVKMECSELQARIDYGNLTGDQYRFAMRELEDCRDRMDAAERKDSAFIEGAEQRFTPADTL